MSFVLFIKYYHIQSKNLAISIIERGSMDQRSYPSKSRRVKETRNSSRMHHRDGGPVFP